MAKVRFLGRAVIGPVVAFGVIAALAVGIGPAASAMDRSILMVTLTPSGTADDQTVAASLTAAGFSVTVIDDDEVQVSGDSVAGGFDGVLITATASPAKVADTFAVTAIPVVSYEYLLFDDLGLTANGAAARGEQGSFKEIDIVDPNHPIIDNAFSGPTEVLTANRKISWGVPGSGADIIATQLGDANRAALFTYEVGTTLADGEAAPARRAGVFLANGSDERLSSNGETLLANTMSWALGSPGVGGNLAPTVDAGSDIVVSAGASLPVQLAGSVADDGLPAGATVTSTWSGPPEVTFDDASSATAIATVPGPGTYTLMLSATDTELSATDSMTITVEPPDGTPEVLMVTTSPTGTVHDRIVAGVLDSAGYVVTTIDDDVVQASGDSVVTGYDAVLISATASAAKIGSRLTSTDVPVVNYKFQLHDDLGLTDGGSANRGQQGTYSQIDVVDPSHPIIGFAFSGETTVLNAGSNLSWGRPAPAAAVAARRLNSSDRAVLFTYDDGDVLANGTPAPARRAGFFLAAVSDDKMNATGETLLVNTVGWAIGVPPSSQNQPPTVDAGEDIVVSAGAQLAVPLSATVSDDGLPDGSSVTATWTGPIGVTFDDPNSLTATATVPGPGIYDLTLTASDTELDAQDVVRINVDDPFGAPALLMVTASATGGADDLAIEGALTSAGYEVTIVDDNVVSATDATGKDVVLISANASPSLVGTTFTSLAIPVVNYEFQLHDDLELTNSGSANRGEQGTFRDIDIVEPGHSIAGGLTGTTEVFTRFSKVTWGKPSTEATIIATLPNDPTRAAVFAYDTGDALSDGTPAPARRAGVFPAAASDGDLSSIGESLLINTVGWAAEGSNLAPSVDAGPDQVVDLAESTDLTGSFVDDPFPVGTEPTVQWSGPPEVVFSDDRSLTPSISFTAAGEYLLTLSVDDGIAVGTDTIQVTAVTQSPPVAAGTVDTNTGEAPLTISVDGTTSSDADGTIVSYDWDFGDGGSATGSTATHTYVVAGSYPVTLTVVDDLGATDSTVVDTIEVSGGGTGGWIDASREYRVALTVPAGAADRIDRPASIDIDFGQVLSGLGASGTLDPASLRVVAVDAQGAATQSIVPSQFDPDSPGGDSGTLLVQVVGTLPAGSTRQFQVYFDVVGGSYQQAPFAPLVSVDPNATDEGLSTLAIDTEIGVYQFDVDGGGFSSLDDVDGNDWVSYSSMPGELGQFRGFPNMIHPENQFHPGGTGVTTTLVSEGPLVATFDVSVDGGAWSGQWKVYPTFARFDLEAAAHDYWFLYEGTPGGSLEPASDLYVRSNGTSVTAATTIGTDIPGVEWAMAGDPGVGRSFYVAHDDDDSLADSYFPLNGAMTVMSFGRRSSGVAKLLTAVPNGFTVGLVDTVSAAAATGPIDSARLPLTGTSGLAEMLPLGEGGPSAFTSISMSGGELPTPPPGSNTDQTGQVIADFDRDGDDDVVVYGRNGPNSVQWYRRDANGGWQLYVIETEELPVEAGGTIADVDSDGDIDIILGGDRLSNKIWWWENPGSGYQPGTDWVRRELLSSGPEKHHDLRFGDVDQDGQGELVFWTQGRPNDPVWDLYVAQVPADPLAAGEWSSTLIYDDTDPAEGVELFDIDLDGNLDIIAGGRLFSYDSPTGTYPSVEISPVSFGRYRAAQLVPGGRPEIIVSSGDDIGPLDLVQWDGSGWTTSSLLDLPGGPVGPWNRGHTLDIGDVNGDGHLDILSAEMYLDGVAGSAQANARSALWYGDGTGSFSVDLLTTGRDNHESQLGDVDADGDLDIVAKPFDLGIPELEIFLNQRFGSSVSSLGDWTKHVIDNKPARAMFIFNADIDEDGDDDLVTGAWWYENPGSISGTWTRNTIGSPLGDALLVDDLDGDGHLDVFGARGPAGTAPLPRQFAWAKGDGTGNFTVYGNIQAGPSSFIQGATTVQFSPTGPKEIWLSWNERSNLVNKIQIPASPTTTQWTLQTGSTISQGEQIEFADIDRDGDLDLVEGHIWLENLGDGSSFTRHDLYTPTSCCFVGVVDTLPLPDRVVVADMNSDGRLDVVVAHEYDPNNRVVWYEQPAGDPRGLWTEHLIASASTAVHSLDVRDLDNDGDQDVVAGEHRLTAEIIEDGQAWVFENTGAGATWQTHLVDGNDAHHDGMQIADLDGDGDFDIFSIGWEHDRVIIYENTFGVVGQPDVTPPVISGVGVTASETAAGVTWSTDELANSTVNYGLTASYGNTAASSSFSTGHSVSLDGLVCETTYHYEIVSQDRSNNVSTTADATFTTSACGSDVLVHLPMNETSGSVAADVSINGNNGALLNGAAFEATSGGDGSGFATRFDGLDDLVDLGVLDVGGSGLTLATWFNADSFSGTSQDGRLISKATGVQADDHVFMLSTIADGDDVKLRARVRVNGSTTTLIATGGALVPGQWYHAAFTYDESQMTLYLDGAAVGSTALTGAVDVDATVAVGVGNQPVGLAARPFDGLLDDVRIVSRGLSAAEVSALAGAAGPL